MYQLMCRLAAMLLEKIPNNQPLGDRLFDAVFRHSVGSSLEIFIHRKNAQGEMEVYLTKRRLGYAYAGLWHVPGVYQRAKETFADAAKNGIVRECLEGIEIPVAKGPVFTINNPNEERGNTNHMLFSAKAVKELTNPKGQWYSRSEIQAMSDDTIVAHHRDILIPKAAKALNYR